MDQIKTRYRAYILFCSVLSLVVGGTIGYFTPRPQRSDLPNPIVISTPLPTPTPSTTTPTPLRVYGSGAVEQAGVYELNPGSIVQDAVAAAGGPAPGADMERINLARELQDQQQVHVPREGEPNPLAAVSGGASEGVGTGAGATVDINTATAAELETLPRIGPTTAQKIVEYREANGPFGSIEEIQEVPGIGPATFAGFENIIAVGR